MAYSGDLRASNMEWKRAKTHRMKYPALLYPVSLESGNNVEPSISAGAIKREYYKLSRPSLANTPYRREAFYERNSRRPQRNTHAAEQNDARVAIGLARSRQEELRDFDADDGLDLDGQMQFPVATQLVLHDAVDVALKKFEVVQFNKMIKDEYEVVKEPEMEDFVFV